MSAIQIGKYIIDNPVFLAPMSGVSDKPFRSAVKKFGAGLTVSEMVASNEAILNTAVTHKRILGTDGEDICYVQIVGSDAKIMSETAQWCVDKGADIIDINFGCPAKKVTGKFCGSALMQYPSTALQILRSVVKAVDVPVTLKMRTGWDDENRNAPEIAKMAEGEGIQLITVHGRTRQQQYRGSADWKFVKQVKDCVNIPVLVNGDIKTVKNSKQALEQSGADGVMIGRACQGRPWFLSQVIAYLNNGTKVADPTIAEQHKTVVSHYNAMISHHGQYKGMLMARKHLLSYLSGINGASEILQSIMQLTDGDEVLDIVNKFYDTKNNEQEKYNCKSNGGDS